MDGGIGAAHYGCERKENQMQRAERNIPEELESARWLEGDLLGSPKTHTVNAAMSVLLGKETTLSCAWARHPRSPSSFTRTVAARRMAIVGTDPELTPKLFSEKKEFWNFVLFSSISEGSEEFVEK